MVWLVFLLILEGQLRIWFAAECLVDLILAAFALLRAQALALELVLVLVFR